MNINWFPGHMAKALRNISEYLPLVDVVVETSDARIARSSRNPELDKLLLDKVPRVILLNKYDLSDEKISEQWIKSLEKDNILSIVGDAREYSTAKKVINLCKELVKEKFEARAKAQRGIKPLRIMIVGIPNTGKSTLINTITGRKATETSNRPGVTRGPQWVKTKDKMVELLDMPGVLWPKLSSAEEQFALAVTGAIKDDLLPIEELAYKLFQQLLFEYNNDLVNRYKIINLNKNIYDIFLDSAKIRGCIQSGGHIDQTRFSKILINEFRNGIIGRVSLEKPNKIFKFIDVNDINKTYLEIKKDKEREEYYINGFE